MVVKIRVPVWVLNILRHLLFRVHNFDNHPYLESYKGIPKRNYYGAYGYLEKTQVKNLRFETLGYKSLHSDIIYLGCTGTAHEVLATGTSELTS